MRYYGPQCPCGLVPCLCPISDTGALERRNPLPIGVYSVDLPNNLVPEFRRWQQGRSAVRVLKTHDDGQHSWLLFSVSAPTIWATGMGFPSIAKETDEKPQAFEPSKDPLDVIAGVLPSREATISTFYMGGFIAVGLALYLYRKEIFDYGVSKATRIRASGNR